ncbi:Gfo/Idh/MocA family protein [Haloarchaeobius sp. DFWS5]|uniref:Gfo/Idh/MocA family protein n=1 Tax=Haloarchaeobius sp. DFWS5 TaxID=3446114 RepID=UPI003EB6D46B
MAAQPIRAGVVGAGTISNTHLSALANHPQTELVGICDLDKDRARTAAREHDIKAVYDIDDLLAQNLDLLHICTSVQSHLPLAKSAIEVGTAVLIEKPVTTTVEEVEELMTHAETYGVAASVVHQHLFSPAMREARQMIRSGKLGEIRSVDLLYMGLTRPDEAHRGEWVFDLPGGEFEEGLPHPIYMTLGIGGYPRSTDDINAVTSLVGDYEQDFAYDNANVQYVAENGALCSVKMCSNGQPQRLMHIHGESGSLLVDQTTQSVVRIDRDYTSSNLTKARKNLDVSADLVKGLLQNGRLMVDRQMNDDWDTQKKSSPHSMQIDQMVRAVRHGSEPPVPLEEGKWTLEIMQTIRDAAVEQDVEKQPIR